MRVVLLVLGLVMAPTVAFFLWAWAVKIKQERKIAAIGATTSTTIRITSPMLTASGNTPLRVTACFWRSRGSPGLRVAR